MPSQRKISNIQSRKYKRTKKQTGSRAQADQIVKLQKKVYHINKEIALDRQYFNYYNETTQSVPQNITTTGYGYNCIPVLNTTRMAKAFDLPSQADLAQDTWVYHGSRINGRIQIDDENTAPIRITVFLVELRKDTREASLYNWGTDLQNMYAPAIAGTTTPDNNNPNPIMVFSAGTGTVFLNNKVFKILGQKTKDIGEVGYGTGAPPVRNIQNTRMDFSFRVKKNVKLSRSQPAIIDALETSRSVINRNAQTFILVVSNNSSLDLGSPDCSVTALHTFSCVS